MKLIWALFWISLTSQHKTVKSPLASKNREQRPQVALVYTKCQHRSGGFMATGDLWGPLAAIKIINKIVPTDFYPVNTAF